MKKCFDRTSPQKKNHFAKMQERIQNRCVEMRRKLERSKSMDTLHTTTVLQNEYLNDEINNLHSNQNVSDLQINRKHCELVNNSPEIQIEVVNDDLSPIPGDILQNYNQRYLNEISDDDTSEFSFNNVSLES